MPVIVPVDELRLKPGGRLPLLKVHAAGGDIGAAESVALYDVPTCPLLRVVGKIVGTAYTGLLRNGTMDIARIATRRKRSRYLPIFFIKIDFIFLSNPSLCLIIHPNS